MCVGLTKCETCSLLIKESFYFKNIKDVKEVRPKFLPLPTSTGMESDEWGLNLNEEQECLDVLIDKLGLKKGITFCEKLKSNPDSLNKFCEKIVREKGKMINDLNLEFANGYFERSYLSLWFEWSKKFTNREDIQRFSEEDKNSLLDIVKMSKGNIIKQKQLAAQMAGMIMDEKILQNKINAAKDLSLPEIEKVFKKAIIKTKNI